MRELSRAGGEWLETSAGSISTGQGPRFEVSTCKGEPCVHVATERLGLIQAFRVVP